MNFRFEELFSVEFHHRYFAHDNLYRGITAMPTAKMQKFMLDNGLLFKCMSAGFMVAYDTSFANNEQNKTRLLKTEAELTFRLDLTDLNFYNYTGNLPHNADKLIFDFRNYNPADKSYRKNGLLQKDDFVGKEDMNDTLLNDFSVKPFGQISIKLNPDAGYDFPQKFILQFDTLFTYRQYILRSDHFQFLKDPAILDKSNQIVFEAPAELTLPNGSKALSIVSKDPVPFISAPKQNYMLVENFNTKINGTKTVLVLPEPDINSKSNISKDKNASGTKKYSVIYL